MSDVDEEANPAIPAATVVLVRDGDDGVETLMLRKNAKLTFGGMWVFPGGRVDAGEDARTAAVREAMEEADLAVDPDSLVPFAHWTPPEGAPKRFATWFFVAPAPEGGEVTIDGGEIHEHVWVTPAEVLARHARGEAELAPPTFVTLQGLLSHADVAAAIAAIADGEVDRYETRLGKTTAGALVCMWDGDAGYESGDAEAPGPRHRITMIEGPWSFERS